MKKSIAAMLVLGTSAALMMPATGAAWARGGDDDVAGSDDNGGRHGGRGADDAAGSDDNGGRNGDRGADDAAGSDDNGGRNGGRGDDDNGGRNGGRGADDNPTGSDDGTADQGRGDGKARSGKNDDNSKGQKRRGRDKNRADVRESGQCSADSAWRLRVKTRKDRVRIKFQVKTGVVGQEWSYSIADNGTEVRSGTKVTHDDSGDFTVQYRDRGVSGPHAATATATNSETGETCDAAASTA